MRREDYAKGTQKNGKQSLRMEKPFHYSTHFSPPPEKLGVKLNSERPRQSRDAFSRLRRFRKSGDTPSMDPFTVRFAVSALLFYAAGALGAGFSADPCSLVDSANPPCFRARTTPTLKAILVHYGDHVGDYDFAAVRKLYIERFNREMSGIVNLEIIDTAALPLKKIARDLAATAAHVGGSDASQKTEARLERLWYYYFSDAGKMIDEIHELLLESGYRRALEEADTVLVISEPQFEALGFASGAYGMATRPSAGR